MKFYFPDSQDQVDPSFDFLSEQRSIHRVRQRDDKYAHEVQTPSPYSGLLISKPIVDGLPGSSGKYTVAQRNRLYREGARNFFRLDQASVALDIMGDCGAFTYIRETEPVYTIDEVIQFYEGVGLDIGIAVDHVIFGYNADFDRERSSDIPVEWKQRQELTLSLASEFLSTHTTQSCTFEPMAVAHGWSPRSYAYAVQQLQMIGYDRIALGGMVPLKTSGILESLRAVKDVLNEYTQLHLLGVTRTSNMHQFKAYGVTSFDSTSPFRQAFKDDQNNYYSFDRNYVALRVPQVDGNTRLRKLVSSGKIDQHYARHLEKKCLKCLREYATYKLGLDDALATMLEYSELVGEPKDRSQQYRETLEDRPWDSCTCSVCKEIGVEVILFRGAERNRRRGFHNLTVFSERIKRELAYIEELDR